MSFMKKHGNKNNKVDYKARLEHKLYLASMSPSLIYDISECNLENVPSNTYKLCEVFRKEALLMHCNRLKSILGGGALKSLSLITVLNIHSNELNNLPLDIIHLTSLKELYLQENNVSKLPDEIVNLKKLSILNISRNKLKCLPEKIGELKNLTILDLSHNKTLQKLPKSLGLAQQVTKLELEGLNISYPPHDIQAGGTIVIIAFLANEVGIDYSPEKYTLEAEEPNKFISKNTQKVFEKEVDIQATLMKLEKLKEQRQNALLEVEENIKQQQKQELQLQDKLKLNRLKLLVDLAQQQSYVEKEVEKVQHKGISTAEKEADNIIKEFLCTNEKERQIQAELLELEKNEEIQILSQSHSEQSFYRTKDTLLSMKNLLEEELLKEKKLADYTAFRDCNAQSLLSLEVKNNEQLLQIMQDQEKNRQDLVTRLKENERLQKAVVAALLERSDARSWSIVQQVNLVETQLAALTSIELEKKNLEINQQINDVADKRAALGAILIDLLEQQEERRLQLLNTVRNIEEKRNGSDLSQENSLFWLLEYQNLSETRPQGLLETLDPTLVRHVAAAGALHCLPFLSSLPALIPELNTDCLRSVGIKNESDRAAIMLAVENYLAEKKLYSNETYAPSAPPVEDEPCTSSSDHSYRFIPSAPTECIVCMDYDCEIIFLPCGHLCCCATCTEMLSAECPMCRTTIERKIKISMQ